MTAELEQDWITLQEAVAYIVNESREGQPYRDAKRFFEGEAHALKLLSNRASLDAGNSKRLPTRGARVGKIAPEPIDPVEFAKGLHHRSREQLAPGWKTVEIHAKELCEFWPPAPEPFWNAAQLLLWVSTRNLGCVGSCAGLTDGALRGTRVVAAAIAFEIEINFDRAKADTFRAIREGRITARGVPDGAGDPQDIPWEEWAHLNLADNPMIAEPTSSGTNWRQLRFRSDQCMAIWPPTDAAPVKDRASEPVGGVISTGRKPIKSEAAKEAMRQAIKERGVEWLDRLLQKQLSDHFKGARTMLVAAQRAVLSEMAK